MQKEKGGGGLEWTCKSNSTEGVQGRINASFGSGNLFIEIYYIYYLLFTTSFELWLRNAQIFAVKGS